MGRARRPFCPNCGPLSLNRQGLIIAHHCPLSNVPAIDGVRHATAHEAPTFDGIAASFWSSPVTAAGGLALLVLLWLSGCV